uniref:Uncharacterized protein n=1 Tax=Fusarium oxysporum (strain Fo5176) TaxID=660025 RepID=A0A0D2XPV6_FUSOF
MFQMNLRLHTLRARTSIRSSRHNHRLQLQLHSQKHHHQHHKLLLLLQLPAPANHRLFHANSHRRSISTIKDGPIIPIHLLNIKTTLSISTPHIPA